MAKDNKRASAGGDEGAEYKFQMPAFDEKAFIRREVEGSKATFVAVGVGVLAGALAYLVNRLAGPDQFYYGWVVIGLFMAGLQPAMRAIGFSDEATKWKSMIGHFFMLFFTALAVWILALNVPGL